MVERNESENLVRACFRAKQDAFPDSGFVGFKWKSAQSLFESPAFSAWEFIVKAQVAMIRSKRNLLDVIISRHKLSLIDLPNGQQFCAKDDETCLKLHVQAGAGMILPTEKLLGKLERLQKLDDFVDQFLLETLERITCMCPMKSYSMRRTRMSGCESFSFWKEVQAQV
jgi:hypothetical protein